jgi:hypothetical protein
MSLDDLEAGPPEQNSYTKQTPEHPKGWEPGVAWDGVSGTLTTGPVTSAPAWDDLLAVWDLDPAVYEVVEPAQYRAWDANLGDGNVQRMFYYRASVRLRRAVETAAEDVDELCRLIARRAPIKATTADGERALVASINDLQIGKGEGGGTAGIISRTVAGIDQFAIRFRELKKAGRAPGQIVIANNGDLTERV